MYGKISEKPETVHTSTTIIANSLLTVNMGCLDGANADRIHQYFMESLMSHTD